MAFLVQSLRIPLEERGRVLPYLAERIGCPISEIENLQIVHEAIDARRSQINFVYHLEFELKQPQKWLQRSRIPLLPAPVREYVSPHPGSLKLAHAPVIVGAGPAGLFAALLLAENGYQPLLLERGGPIEERVKAVEQFWQSGALDPQSNVQFGEGGAGTFSDGKLTTQIRDPRIFQVLQQFVAAGAPADILYSHKPHIGTDRLRQIMIRMRQRILALGGQIHFYACLDHLFLAEDRLQGIRLTDGNEIAAEALILAIGHSARDTFANLFAQNLAMESKAFSLGVRIEHLQSWIDAAQYGSLAGHPKLDAADYKLVYHAKSGRTVYSFCMCPGGQVVASASEPGYLVTNGMSYHARDGKNANSGLLVAVSPQDYGSDAPLAGMEFQRKWEALAYAAGGAAFRAPLQRLDDFLLGTVTKEPKAVLPTYRPGVEIADLNRCLPEYVSEALREAIPALARKLKGFDQPEAILTGIETRSSSPLRILRNENGESSIKGLYPAGEGAGYAGGIVSSAVDGLRAAEQIIQQYAPR